MTNAVRLFEMLENDRDRARHLQLRIDAPKMGELVDAADQVVGV